ncbi:MAG: peptidylprolyl isomerase [Cytophagaceae bacterium]|nr:peptidylprolyl isomerase [Cytophagaceae bacterium]
MGIISTIQQRTGLVVGLIAASLILFILGSDLFSNRSWFSSNGAGKINGKSISADEYREALKKNENEYITNAEKTPGENEMASIEYQAWNDLLVKYAYTPQYEEAGVSVTADEKKEIFYGKFVHQTIKQAFGGQADFSGDQVVQFVENLKQQVKSEDPNMKQRAMMFQAKWDILKNRTVEARMKEKYLSVLKRSEYVTKEEAKRIYLEQTEKAEVKYIYIPYSSIQDSLVKVNDDQIEDYIARNAKNYEVEEGRSIDLAVFTITPTSEDSAATREQLATIKSQFISAESDTQFVMDISENAAEPKYLGPNELPESLKGLALQNDSVYGPYLSGTRYGLFKVLGSKNDTVSTLRASHILFRIDADKEASRKKANAVLDSIRKGSDFGAMAAKYGTDGTAQRGGDLGFFSNTGQMVKPFEDACFKFNGTGVLPSLVETQFGYHIIKITSPKNNKKYLIATVEKEINPLQGKDLAYTNATNFASSVSDTQSFNEEAAKNKSLAKFSHNNAGKQDKSLSGVSSAKEIVRWAFTEAKKGKPSKVFATENLYVVAVVTKERSKGLAMVDDVRQEVTNKVRNELKADQIIEKLKTLEGDLDKISKAYGTDAVAGSATDVTFSSSSIGTIGWDPVVTGTAFGLKDGKRAAPVKGENGVVLIEMVKRTPAPEVADYNQYKTQKEQQRSGSIDYYADEAIKKLSNIEDERFKF